MLPNECVFCVVHFDEVLDFYVCRQMCLHCFISRRSCSIAISSAGFRNRPHPRQCCEYTALYFLESVTRRNCQTWWTHETNKLRIWDANSQTLFSPLRWKYVPYTVCSRICVAHFEIDSGWPEARSGWASGCCRRGLVDGFERGWARGVALPNLVHWWAVMYTCSYFIVFLSG